MGCTGAHDRPPTYPASLARTTSSPANNDPFDDLPCRFRGPTVRTVLCEVCGPEKGLQVPVRKCAIHGECVRRKYKVGTALGANKTPIGICIGCNDREEPEAVPKQKLILGCSLSPGDVMTVTAAIESLHATYPGKYLTDVRVPSGCREIFDNNPHLTPLSEPDAARINLNYPTIHESSVRTTPFLEGYTLDLGAVLGLPLRLTTNRPHVYLSPEERRYPPQLKEYFAGRELPYCIINAGVKRDFTAKQWPVEHYQEVVNRTRGRIQWVQIGERHHDHEPLTGAIDLRGKTNTRQFLRLCAHSQGGLGPVTFLQHAMAAFEKPYVCLLGGREPATWVQYPHQHTLHTIGALPCCKTRACWKSRVTPLGDGDEKDRPEKLCEQPVVGLTKPVARCMAMIQPGEVLTVLDRIAVGR